MLKRHKSIVVYFTTTNKTKNAQNIHSPRHNFSNVLSKKIRRRLFLKIWPISKLIQIHIYNSSSSIGSATSFLWASAPWFITKSEQTVRPFYTHCGPLNQNFVASNFMPPGHLI